MRTIVTIVGLLMLTSCFTYKQYIAVQEKNNIPDGTQSIVLTEDIEIVKKAFISKGIMMRSLEGGYETEEILIDEGTRAMYKIHEFDGIIRVTAFWGITNKVKSNITLWAGYAAASSSDVHSWDKVVYDNNKLRSKSVFDYAVQIIEHSNLEYNLRSL